MLSYLGDILDLLLSELANELSRGTGPELARRDTLTLQQQRTRGQNRAVGNYSTVQNSGTNVNHGTILNGTAVNGGSVSYDNKKLG
jgi:hypothetical protein